MGLCPAARPSLNAQVSQFRAWQAAGRTVRPSTVGELVRVLGAAAAAGHACGCSATVRRRSNHNYFIPGCTEETGSRTAQGRLVGRIFRGCSRMLASSMAHNFLRCTGEAGRPHLPRPAAARGGRAAARAGRGHGGRARRAAGAALPRGRPRPVRRPPRRGRAGPGAGRGRRPIRPCLGPCARAC
jgi:hypothetical protein